MGPAASPEAEIMRLQRQLEVREEVIRQLNRQLHASSPGATTPEPDEAPAVIEEYVYKARVLEAEVARLRDQVCGVSTGASPSERHQAAAGTAAHRGLFRRAGSKFKRMLRR
jgi:hypothetical protein